VWKLIGKLKLEYFAKLKKLQLSHSWKLQLSDSFSLFVEFSLSLSLSLSHVNMQVLLFTMVLQKVALHQDPSIKMLINFFLSDRRFVSIPPELRVWLLLLERFGVEFEANSPDCSKCWSLYSFARNQYN
jgi:hypothetical protein